jgi:alpha-N-acetylglucosamine transferase
MLAETRQSKRYKEYSCDRFTIRRDSYLPGVQALQRSLLAVGSLHSLIVMITPDTVSECAVDVLENEGCVVQAIERYVPGGRIDHRNYKLACYAECWCKLRMWEMTEFERLVYLDADMLVLRNIDDLFVLPEGFWAAPDCAAGRPTQQERDACALLAVSRGLPPTYFNAGMYVMSPCMDTMEDFGMALQEGRFEIGGYAEQDFLNAYYQHSWRCLSAAYNLQKGVKCHHAHLWKPEEAAILHYTDRKPWCADGTHPEDHEHADIVELWWRAFKNGNMGEEAYSTQGR